MVSISPLNYASVHKSLKAAKDNLPYDIDDVSSQLGMSTWTKEYKSGSPNRMKENLPMGIDGSSSSSRLAYQTASSLSPNPSEEKENLLKEGVTLTHSDNSQFRLISLKKPCQGSIDEEQLKLSSSDTHNVACSSKPTKTSFKLPFDDEPNTRTLRCQLIHEKQTLGDDCHRIPSKLKWYDDKYKTRKRRK
ncbi:unnamed protein product [Trichobilharzia szidati]|nr:unnamed protein product [Trichobilharzia szidati]